MARMVRFAGLAALTSMALLGIGGACIATPTMETNDNEGGGGSSSNSTSSSPSGCGYGSKVACSCGDAGATGTQVCVGAAFSSCDCLVVDPGPPPTPACGDSLCNGTETCKTCPDDCGVCPVCDLAPTCTGAVAVPTSVSAAKGFDNESSASYVCGTDGTDYLATTCLAPQLRMRVTTITVKNSGASFRDLNVFCTITADDGTASAVAATDLVTGAVEGKAYPLDVTKGIFWGQKELARSATNLTLSFTCYDSPKGQSTFSSIMGSIQSGAAALSGVAGPYSWAFGAGSVAAGVLGSAVAGNPDAQAKLSVQQTIDRKGLLDLTNGRTWTIHQSGEGDTGVPDFWHHRTWDWTLTVEAWGCADAKSSVH